MKLIVLTLALCGAAPGALAQASLFDGFWGSADAPECLSADGSFSTCEALTIGQGQFQVRVRPEVVQPEAAEFQDTRTGINK